MVRRIVCRPSLALKDERLGASGSAHGKAGGVGVPEKCLFLICRAGEGGDSGECEAFPLH